MTGRARRVLVISTVFGAGGGAQRYSSDIAAALQSVAGEVEAFSTGTARSLKSRTRLGVAYLVALRQAQLVWIAHPRIAWPFVLGARLAGVPSVVSTLGFETWGRVSWSVRLTLRFATEVTVLSEFSHHASRLTRAAHRLPPTVSDDLLQYFDSMTQLGHPDRDTVLFVGRVGEPYKGLELLLDAFQLVPERYRLQVIGAGNEADVDRLMSSRLASRLSVAINASDPELAQAYSRAAVVVLPSRVQIDESGRYSGGEGFGMVILEAAAFGVPVVTSDEGACPETVGLLGNGVAVSCDAKIIGMAIANLLERPELREALALYGMENFRRFSRREFNRTVQRIAATAALRP